MSKPVLFLDFDWTIFDTGKFYDWLGEDPHNRIEELRAGKIAPPDFSTMLYPDTLKSLARLRETHSIVLLTYTTKPDLQEMKITQSGVSSFFDKIIMVGGDNLGSGKGMAVKGYLDSQDLPAKGHYFVDDTPSNIEEVEIVNPEIRCMLIERDDAHRAENPKTPSRSSRQVLRSLSELVS